MAFHAYLFFSDGQCKEAITRYQEIFGGELQIMGFGDMPPGEDAPPDVDTNLVMHASLTFPDGDSLLASDDPSGDSGPVKGVSISYTATTVEDCERIFGELSDGGSVDMPLESVFWAQRFGMCTDRFGIPWMVNAVQPMG